MRAGALLAALLLLPVVACTYEVDPPEADAPAETGPLSPPVEPGPGPESKPAMAIVGHATRPQLELDKRTARRIIDGELRSVRGLRVLEGLRTVERNPDAIAVVPLDQVGPTVVAAKVGGVDPIRDAPGAVDVMVAGDIMLVRGVPDATAALAPMSRLLRGADIAIGNLESTLSRNGEPMQDPVTDSFGGTPALLTPLRVAGFDALSLANNHSGDYGPIALLETVERMVASPITPFGAGATLREASRPAVLEVDGTTFAFVGFNAIGETPQALPRELGAPSVRMPPRTGSEINRGDLDHVRGIIRRAKRGADVVVVLPHWGEQYTHTPQPAQRVVSEELVAAGADLVVGGHPHWVQGMDAVDGVPVIHSLGNFVFDMDFPFEEVREGVVMEATWWGKELKAFRLVPYRMEIGEYAPRVVDGSEILADVWGASTGPYAR